MKLKLTEGFGAVRNIVQVEAHGAAFAAGVVGDMHKMRKSGWRGGPTYQFHPNAHGESLGLKGLSGISVRLMLKQLGIEKPNPTLPKVVDPDFTD